MGRDQNPDVPETQGTGLSRRTIVKGTGLAIAAAALSGGVASAAQKTTAAPKRNRPATQAAPVMPTLSKYMSEAYARELPPEAVEKAKHHILDTFAAMISGADLPPGRAALKFAEAYSGGKEVATVVGSNILCSPMEAALTNGMLAHSDETDDSHAFSQCHPGAPVLPAALAAGERFGIDGNHFLRAVTLGYDIGPRVTMSFDSIKFRNESHKSTHAIAGIFGAAAAAGCAAKLSAQQMRWLLDYTGQQSSGIGAWGRDTDHIEKAFVFAGMTARSGVTAALLIHSGMNGLDDIFSGADNYFQAYELRDSPANPAILIEKLGERYEVVRTNIKKWSVGSPIQAPLDALEIILKRQPVDPDNVKQVIVRIAHTEAKVVNEREMPDISLQHMVAVMLTDKTVSFHAAHDKARMKDPAILRHRAKVKLIPSDELEKFEPERQAIVEITLMDGTQLREYVKAVRGTVLNPMPREEIVAKARDLITPVLGAPTAAKLIDAVLGIEKVKDIRELRPLLQRA